MTEKRLSGRINLSLIFRADPENFDATPGFQELKKTFVNGCEHLLISREALLYRIRENLFKDNNEEEWKPPRIVLAKEKSPSEKDNQAVQYALPEEDILSKAELDFFGYMRTFSSERKKGQNQDKNKPEFAGSALTREAAVKVTDAVSIFPSETTLPFSANHRMVKLAHQLGLIKANPNPHSREKAHGVYFLFSVSIDLDRIGRDFWIAEAKVIEDKNSDKKIYRIEADEFFYVLVAEPINDKTSNDEDSETKFLVLKKGLISKSELNEKLNLKKGEKQLNKLTEKLKENFDWINNFQLHKVKDSSKNEIKISSLKKDNESEVIKIEFELSDEKRADRIKKLIEKLLQIDYSKKQSSLILAIVTKTDSQSCPFRWALQFKLESCDKDETLILKIKGFKNVREAYFSEKDLIVFKPALVELDDEDFSVIKRKDQAISEIKKWLSSSEANRLNA